ncbi:uncharacterized protein UTRI_06229 [Ustilago trichophora]|uniref:Uncharacterized protein n=1 Tax=Ustilago trichophora TaxID=86804 RepID=A0A5C3EG88_9BASI|nr:uncharacterized protein UTRI_06229 [Ustilago trichophora]
MSTHPFAASQLAIKCFALICAVALLHCWISASSTAEPMQPNWNDENPIPSLTVSRLSPDRQNQLVSVLTQNLNDLGAEPRNMAIVDMPPAQHEATAETVRLQLQQKFLSKHLLYLASEGGGHLYVFPLDDVLQNPRRIHTVLITVRPRRIAYPYNGRDIDFHNFDISFDVENRNIFMQRLLGADGANGGPVTHDLYNLFHNNILHF